METRQGNIGGLLRAHRAVAGLIQEELAEAAGISARRQLESLGEVASERYLDHVPFPGQSPGLRGFSDRVGLLVRAFDPQWSILDLVADGEKAAVRWTLSGVHRESFLSFAASGRAIRLTGIDIYRVEHGRFAEHWNVVDLSPLVRPPLTGG